MKVVHVLVNAHISSSRLGIRSMKEGLNFISCCG